MTITIMFSTPVSKLPYEALKREREDYQSSNDPAPIKHVDGNRFRIGDTSYFAPDCCMKDPAEACKGVPKPVYQWLMQNAPDALIEMSAWATDLSGPWPAEDAPGDADVFVNFADDHSSAVRFRATFDGVVPEFEEEDEAEAI